MRLLSLQLSNIRSYPKLSLEFPKGIVLFQGDIGSGKSTILMAIEFALFGLGSLKADTLLTRGTTRGEVSLTFEVDGISYEIGRTLTKKQNASAQSSKDSYLIADGMKEPLTVSELKPRVLEILKFHESPNVRSTSRVFRYAVYTPQEEIKSILYGRERENTIRLAFGMEDYKTATDNAKNVIREIRDKMTQIGDQTVRLETLQSRLDHTRAQMISSEAELKQLELQKQQLDRQRVTADSELDAAREKMDAYTSLRAEHTHVRQQISDKERSIIAYQKTISDNKNRLVSLQDDLDRNPDAPPPTTKSSNQIQQTILLLQEKSSQIKKQALLEENGNQDIQRHKNLLNKKSIEDIHNEMLQFQRSLSLNQADIETIRGRLANARTSRGEHVGTIKSLRIALSRAQNLKDRCEYCNNILDPAYVEKLTIERNTNLHKARAGLDEVDADIRTLETNRVRIQTSIENTQRQIESARYNEKIAKDSQRIARDVSDAVRRRVQAQADYDAIPYMESGFSMISGETPEVYLNRLKTALDNHTMMRNRRASLQDQIHMIHENVEQNQARYDSDMGDINQKEERLAEINSEMASYGDVSGILRECESRLVNLDRDIGDIRIRVARYKTELDGLNQQETGLISDIKTVHDDMERYKKYGDHMEWLQKFFIPSLEGIETRALNLLRHEFNEFYQEWYTMLVDDPTKSSRIDERFGPVVEQGRYEQDVDSLSGGEKTGVALAFRLALNSTMRQQAALPDTNIIILDEPTDGFSRDQMQKVSDILRSIDSNQIIMVSHERELEDYAEHRFRVTKTEGVSTVERITF